MKALSVALDLTAESGIGVPIIPAGTTLASGYYTDPNTGIKYYYNAGYDQWYVVSGLSLIPLAISWQPSPSAKVDLLPGDTLRINLIFTYIGPAQTREFYAAIGDNKTSGSFGEWFGGFHSVKSIAIPLRSTLSVITGNYINITIPIDPPFGYVWPSGGYDGAVYVKMVNGITLTEGVNCTPYYYNVVRVVTQAGEITNFALASFVKA